MYSSLLKKTVPLLTLLTISGCSILPDFRDTEIPVPVPPEVVIKTVEVKTPIVHPELPRAIQLRIPEWYVVSDKNLEEFLERIAKQHDGQVVFTAMSIADYELMAYNMQEIKRYINQLKEVVIYYRNVNEEKE
jgi:uncharacterized protein with von Willebrand factor type A (vWA) domain